MLQHRNRWVRKENTNPREVRSRGIRISLAPREEAGLRFERAEAERAQGGGPAQIAGITEETDHVVYAQPRVIVAPSVNLPMSFYGRKGSVRNWAPRMVL